MRSKFFKANFLLLCILLIAILLRFVNYTSRVSFGQDSARDAIIALESIKHHKLPLLGPPSSAWGFNFGPLYYYAIVLFTLLIPGTFAPWLGFSLLSVFTVLLVYKTGERVFGKTFGLISGLICAVSFGEVANSANLLNTQLVSFATALAFFFLERTLSGKSRISPLILGFSVALAINCHFQAMSLLLLLPLAVLFSPGSLKIKSILSLKIALGFFVSFLPLLVFELQHNFAWFKSVLDYSLHGQQRFYVPVRWLTEITQFWPGIFGRVLSGDVQAGYLYSGIILLSFVFLVFHQRKFPKFFFIVSLTFILEILSVRYYKGPRSSEYFIIAHQFAIFFLAYALWVFTKFNRILGATLLIVFLAITIRSDAHLLVSRTNSADVLGLFAKEKQYVGTSKVTLYGTANSWGSSIALHYLSQKESLAGDDAMKLIVCDNLEGSTKGLADYCPKEGRLLQSGRLVIYHYEQLSPEQRSAYQIEELRGSIYYDRTYNNYESR